MNPQPSTLNPQPSTLNPQPGCATLDRTQWEALVRKRGGAEGMHDHADAKAFALVHCYQSKQ